MLNLQLLGSDFYEHIVPVTLTRMNDHYKFFIEKNPLTIFAKIMQAFKDESDEQWLKTSAFPELIQLFQDFMTKSHRLDFEQ